MKYIMFDWPKVGRVPVLFADALNHGAVAKAVTAPGAMVMPGAVPVSAGMVRVRQDGHVECYHYSEALDLHPAERDEREIELHLDLGRTV